MLRRRARGSTVTAVESSPNRGVQPPVISSNFHLAYPFAVWRKRGLRAGIWRPDRRGRQCA
jgi:hypothetical protein